MRVFRSVEGLPEFNNGVLTIGTFDGVHLGHQQILKRINEEAAAIGGESIILTFHPHPRLVVNPNLRAASCCFPPLPQRRLSSATGLR